MKQNIHSAFSVDFMSMRVRLEIGAWSNAAPKPKAAANVDCAPPDNIPHQTGPMRNARVARPDVLQYFSMVQS